MTWVDRLVVIAFGVLSGLGSAVALAATPTPVSLSAYTGNVTDVTDALGTALTGTIVPAVMIIAGGLFALRVGFGLVRRFSK